MSDGSCYFLQMTVQCMDSSPRPASSSIVSLSAAANAGHASSGLLQELSSVVTTQSDKRTKTLLDRRARDRAGRKKLREEEPDLYQERLALRRIRERESRKQEREDNAIARSVRLEKRRLREKEKRALETPKERTERLLKRRMREERRVVQSSAVSTEVAQGSDSSTAQLTRSSSGSNIDSATTSHVETGAADECCDVAREGILEFVQIVNSPRCMPKAQ